jgi:hypothetical protein
MPLDYALEAFALRHTDDIDPIAFFENIDLHRLAYRDIADFLELAKHTARGGIVFLEMTQLSLRKLTVFDLIKRKLNGFIAVTLFGLERNHTTGTRLDDRHRSQLTLIKDLRHSEFFA